MSEASEVSESVDRIRIERDELRKTIDDVAGLLRDFVARSHLRAGVRRSAQDELIATVARLEESNRDYGRALGEWQERTRDAEGLVAAVEEVAEAARTPDCNFSEERECGPGPDGAYRHHPRFCPRGRLETALALYDAALAGDVGRRVLPRRRADVTLAALVEREACLADVASEEELDGRPPPGMSEREAEIARAAVRATKKSIAGRILTRGRGPGEASR